MLASLIAFGLGSLPGSRTSASRKPASHCHAAPKAVSAAQLTSSIRNNMCRPVSLYVHWIRGYLSQALAAFIGVAPDSSSNSDHLLAGRHDGLDGGCTDGTHDFHCGDVYESSEQKEKRKPDGGLYGSHGPGAAPKTGKAREKDHSSSSAGKSRVGGHPRGANGGSAAKHKQTENRV